MPDLEAEVTVLPAQPQNLSICSKCLLNCYWQDAPGGGWWIHEWPNRLLEAQVKNDPRKVHDADPGWEPTQHGEDVI